MKRFILRERSIMQNAVAYIADLDLAQTWEVVVRPHKPRKTDEQRNTLHLWLRVLAAETGHSVGEMKHHVKVEFLGYEEVLILGVPHRVLRSTEDLKRDEYSVLLERVAALAANLGIRLPAPEVDHV